MLTTYLQAFLPVSVMALIVWFYSFKKRNVNSVDALWSLMFLACAAVYLFNSSEIDIRNLLVFSLILIWSIRLSVHLMVRNWGHDEDHRYQTIRANNSPDFSLKSLYIVFGLQAILAWIISAPLLFALQPLSSFQNFDVIALSLWILGFGFEASADYQLLKFKRDPANAGKVLDTGVWKYTRHPNYFGEFCIWWAFFLFSIPAGGWWTIFAPLLMSFLLLKVSGVVMMERNIQQRRPEYARYIENTNTFFPGLPSTICVSRLEKEE